MKPHITTPRYEEGMNKRTKSQEFWEKFHYLFSDASSAAAAFINRVTEIFLISAVRRIGVLFSCLLIKYFFARWSLSFIVSVVIWSLDRWTISFRDGSEAKPGMNLSGISVSVFLKWVLNSFSILLSLSLSIQWTTAHAERKRSPFWQRRSHGANSTSWQICLVKHGFGRWSPAGQAMKYV